MGFHCITITVKFKAVEVTGRIQSSKHSWKKFNFFSLLTKLAKINTKTNNYFKHFPYVFGSSNRKDNVYGKMSFDAPFCAKVGHHITVGTSFTFILSLTLYKFYIICVQWACRKTTQCIWKLHTIFHCSIRQHGLHLFINLPKLTSHAMHTYLGGRIALSISSVCWLFCASIGGSLLVRGGWGTGPAAAVPPAPCCWLTLRDRAYHETNEENRY